MAWTEIRESCPRLLFLFVVFLGPSSVCFSFSCFGIVHNSENDNSSSSFVSNPLLSSYLLRFLLTTFRHVQNLHLLSSLSSTQYQVDWPDQELVTFSCVEKPPPTFALYMPATSFVATITAPEIMKTYRRCSFLLAPSWHRI